MVHSLIGKEEGEALTIVEVTPSFTYKLRVNRASDMPTRAKAEAIGMKDNKIETTAMDDVQAKRNATIRINGAKDRKHLAYVDLTIISRTQV